MDSFLELCGTYMNIRMMTDGKKKHLNILAILTRFQFYTNHHDVGFMINCSYGNAYRLIGDSVYKQVLINAAYSLATRYRAKARLSQSWILVFPVPVSMGLSGS